jgi:hypothetical protein
MGKQTIRSWDRNSSAEWQTKVGSAGRATPWIGTKPPFLRTTVSVGFRINLPVAMPDGQRLRDNHCGCRAVDKISVAEASEKHLFPAHGRRQLGFTSYGL